MINLESLKQCRLKSQHGNVNLVKTISVNRVKLKKEKLQTAEFMCSKL